MKPRAMTHFVTHGNLGSIEERPRQMGFWQWFRDSQRPRGGGLGPLRAQPRRTTQAPFPPGQPTKVPEVFPPGDLAKYLRNLEDLIR